MSNLIKYRRDIDGLRALAVIPVVLFHAGYDWISGGFVGVDIFFVISGFLISSILIREMNAGTFTFARFYERRVRRIVPALLTVLFATLVAGYFLLLPEEYVDLGKAAAAALGFVPNVYYWSTSSTYFGIDIATLPLLHTWSLGIEEQFYIFFPLLLVALRKLRGLLLLALVLGALFAVSLAANLWMVNNDPRFSFYMLPTRAWELLAGVLLSLGVLAPVRHRLAANLLALAGLLLILLPMVLLDDKSVFPGLNAVYPVLGAALLIHSNAAVETWVAWLLGRKVFVYVGTISYSLYLWHWPIVLYTKMLWDTPDNKPLIVALSVLCASLSYYFVEGRYRNRRSAPEHRPGRLGELAGVAAVLALMMTTLVLTHGLPARMPAAVSAVIDNPANHAAHDDCQAFASTQSDREAWRCRLGVEDAEPRFLVWGDSHAGAVAYALGLAAKKLGVAGVNIWTGGCRPLLGVFREGKPRCLDFNREVRRYIEAHPSIEQVYLAGYWRVPVSGEGYDNNNFLIMDQQTRSVSTDENARVFIRGLQRTMHSLAGRQVFLIQDVPEIGAQFGKSVVSLLARQVWTHQEAPRGQYFDERADVFEEKFRELLTRMPNPPVYIRIRPRLCPDKQCPLQSGNTLIYSDGDHLSRYGASLLEPVFLPYLSQTLTAKK